MRWSHARIVTVVLGVAILMTSSLTSGAEKIKITVPGLSTAFAPLYQAQSAGYFAAEGLDVDIVAVVGAGRLQSVLSREAQFTVAPGTYHLMVYEKGQRLFGVMSMLTRNSLNVVMHREAARHGGESSRRKDQGSERAEGLRRHPGRDLPPSPRLRPEGRPRSGNSSPTSFGGLYARCSRRTPGSSTLPAEEVGSSRGRSRSSPGRGVGSAGRSRWRTGGTGPPSAASPARRPTSTRRPPRSCGAAGVRWRSSRTFATAWPSMERSTRSVASSRESTSS